MPTATQVQASPWLEIHADNGPESRWAVVLAGGEDARTRRNAAAPEKALRPRQYCSFAGSHTLLQQTLDRAVSMVAPEQIVTVIGKGHRKFIAETHSRPVPGSIIEQPLNFGTAAGILLPAAFVSEIDPEATIIILPSDHLVHPEKMFLEYATRAFQLAEQYPDRLILVGASADRPETDYGWIVAEDLRNESQTGASNLRCLQATAFREKPDFAEASALLQQDGFWSTMVIAVKARTLWAMARKCLPAMMASFDAFRQVLRAVREGEVEAKYESFALTDLYQQLKPADFSKDVLEHVTSQILVMPMHGVTWCDWGRPRHLTDSLVLISLHRSIDPDPPEMRGNCEGNTSSKRNQNPNAREE